MDTTCKPEHSQKTSGAALLVNSVHAKIAGKAGSLSQDGVLAKTNEEESTQKPQLERPEFMEPAPSQSPTKSNSPKRKLKTE